MFCNHFLLRFWTLPLFLDYFKYLCHCNIICITAEHTMVMLGTNFTSYGLITYGGTWFKLCFSFICRIYYNIQFNFESFLINISKISEPWLILLLCNSQTLQNQHFLKNRKVNKWFFILFYLYLLFKGNYNFILF